MPCVSHTAARLARMSHCRNSSRRIKYFYIVAFLSVWKNFQARRQVPDTARNWLFSCKPGAAARKRPPFQAAHYYASGPICTTNSFLLGYLYKSDMNSSLQIVTFFRASMVDNLYIDM
jgi:hypothetical protein